MDKHVLDKVSERMFRDALGDPSALTPAQRAEREGNRPTLADATLSELASELGKADVAIALGIQPRKWKAYRKAIQAEINRKAPLPPTKMTDAEILAELEQPERFDEFTGPMGERTVEGFIVVSERGYDGEYRTYIRNSGRLAVSPYFPDLAALYPWMRANGWSSAEYVNGKFFPWRVERAG